MIENLFTFVRTLGNQRIQGKKFFVTQVGLLGAVSDSSGSIGTAGKVLSSTGSGVSWITVGSGSSNVAVLNDLTDVVISTAAAGNLLRFNGTSWVNWAPNFVTGYGSLNDLSDVTLTTPANGARLVYSSTTSQWIDAAPLAFGKMYYGTAIGGDAATTTVITNGTKLSIGTGAFSTNLNVGQVDITTGIAGQGSIHIGATQNGSTYLLASNNKIQVGSQTEGYGYGDPGDPNNLVLTFTPSTLNIQPLGGDTVFGGYTTATGYKTPSGSRSELLTSAGTKTLTDDPDNGQILRWIQPVGGVGNWYADDENSASTPSLDAVTDVGSTTTNSITVGNLSTSGKVTTPLIERDGVLTINSEEQVDYGDPNPNLLYVSWTGDNKFVINADGYAIATTGYKVVGGTASGFLKANGTVDTSVYLTSMGNLDDIGDVELDSTQAGEALIFNGEDWVNSPLPDYVSKVQHLVKAGVAITKGQAVYVTSANGTNMIVGLASNDTEATSSKTMGLAVSTAAINNHIFIVTEGLIAGLNTSTATVGNPVWLGVNGNLIFGLANKPVAPAHLVYIGVVTRSHANNGEIFVHIQNGFELNELHDVLITGTITGQLIRRDGDGLWKNWTPNYITENSVDVLTNKRINLSTSIASIVNIDSVDPFLGQTDIVLYQDGIDRGGRIYVNLSGRISISNPGIGYYTGSVTATPQGDVVLEDGGAANTYRFYVTVSGNTLTGTVAEFNEAITDGNLVTEAYVQSQIANLVDSAPATLDTLNELAAALGDDASFSTTVATSIGTKQNQLDGTGFVKASGTTISYDNSTYLTSETDPVFTASPAFGIGELNITKWDTAHSWGNHADAGYLTSLPDHSHSISDVTGLQTALDGKVPTTRTLTINGTEFDLSADRSWTISSADGYISNVTLLESGTLKFLGEGSAFTGNIDLSTLPFQPIGNYLTAEADTLDSVTDRNAVTTNAITVGGALISASAPLLDFVDTNSFTDVNDRFRIRAVGDAGRIQWYDSSASSTLDLMHFSLNGNVGIGTTSPAKKLDVRGGYFVTSDGGTNEVCFVQGGNGYAYFGNLNAGKAAFGNSENWTTLVADGGNVGIGTTTPATKLDVSGVITATDGNSTNWNTAYGWGNHADYGYWNTDSVDAKNVKSAEVVFVGNVTVEGTFTESSSIRFKENITPLDPALDKVNQLEAVSYNKIGVDDREIGLIAEDVAELFPEVVTYNEEGQPQGIQYQRLSVILLKAMQEQNAVITALTERVKKLENK